MPVHSSAEMFPTDGKEEAGEQDEKGPVERSVPGASGKAAALLQDCERVQRGERAWAGWGAGVAKIRCSFTHLKAHP